MQALRITTNEFPNYPLIIEQGRDWTHAFESICDGHPIFDSVVPLAVGCTLNINIEVVEMTKEEFDALEPWEP